MIKLSLVRNNEWDSPAACNSSHPSARAEESSIRHCVYNPYTQYPAKNDSPNIPPN